MHTSTITDKDEFERALREVSAAHPGEVICGNVVFGTGIFRTFASLGRVPMDIYRQQFDAFGGFMLDGQIVKPSAAWLRRQHLQENAHGGDR